MRQRKKTDTKVLNFIKAHPPSHTRQIIKGTSMSPNSVVASLRRLRGEKKIITHKESKFFKNSRIPPGALAYLPNYPDERRAVDTAAKNIRKDINEAERSLLAFFDKDFKKRRPMVRQHADALSHRLRLQSDDVVKILQYVLGIRDVNESMIGFYIYKQFFEREKQFDLPYCYDFYYKMLPKKYCKIGIQSPSQLIEFMKHNFQHSLDLQQEIESGFSCFNRKTKRLAILHTDEFFTQVHKDWLHSNGFMN
ncbi:MAG: hypothetical protein KGI33_01245 [Thaumarchaeota archaeon]|nr:hypothetical protein [Nitrososphaerota archaeon]